MRILHTVEFYQPSVGGTQEVVRQLSERLVGLGHDVTVATARVPERSGKVIGGVKIAEFGVAGNLVRGLTGGVKEYEDFLLNSDFDVITNFAAQQWATDLMLPLLGRIGPKKVFVPTGFSGLYLPEYRAYFEKMKSWMKQYDMNVFLSHNYRDINFARENGVKNIIWIPNGASEEEFLSESPVDIGKQFGIPEDAFLILHVGSHTGVKGHREAIEVFRRANIRDAVFLLIGNDFGGCTRECIERQNRLNKDGDWKKSRKRLIVADLNRNETVAAYKASDLFLFTSNIECSPIVLFECMASRTPFMTTDVGNSAEIAEWCGGGIVLPTRKSAYLRKGMLNSVKRIVGRTVRGRGPFLGDASFSIAKVEEAVPMLEKIWREPEKRKEMAEAGFAAWKEKFTWEKIARDYERLYEGLIEEAGEKRVISSLNPDYSRKNGGYERT